MSDAAQFFGIHDEPTAALYESTAHELAFALAATALQQGLNEANADLERTIAALATQPADPLHVALAMTVERLLVFLRLIAKRSPHPLAENLRTHPDLTSVCAKQLVDGLSAWLASQQGRPVDPQTQTHAEGGAA